MEKLENPAASSGRWGDCFMPHRGWECVGVDDLGAPDAVCEMCERQNIRYVHEMQHPKYGRILRCGCICAGYMEGDLPRAERRDKEMRAAARRRQAWPDLAGWYISRQGNPTIRIEGSQVIVFRRGASWAASVRHKRLGEPTFTASSYPTVRAAKLAGFDLLHPRQVQPPAPEPLFGFR